MIVIIGKLKRPLNDEALCPKCGAAEKDIHVLYEGYTLICSNCQHQGQSKNYPHLAIKAWNKAAKVMKNHERIDGQ